MPCPSTAQALNIRAYIIEQPKEKRDILIKLLRLQEKYKGECVLRMLSLGLYRRGVRKAKAEINKIYTQYPEEAKLLKELYSYS